MDLYGLIRIYMCNDMSVYIYIYVCMMCFFAIWHDV